MLKWFLPCNNHITPLTLRLYGRLIIITITTLFFATSIAGPANHVSLIILNMVSNVFFGKLLLLSNTMLIYAIDIINIIPSYL